jgi:NAD(P)-dependent dehydrogenase (short-subunit alcohol dehydrogenase family)
MFINNAISMYAQTELLFEVWHRWQHSGGVHHIWNISTRVCEWSEDKKITGLTMRQSMEYRNQKMALELAHRQLDAQPSNITMTLIRPGEVNTQPFSRPNSESAESYVKKILSRHNV